MEDKLQAAAPPAAWGRLGMASRAGHRPEVQQPAIEAATESSPIILQFPCSAMGKAIRRRIDFVLKRKRDDISEAEMIR